MTKKTAIRDLRDAIKATSETKAKGYWAMLGNLAGEVLTAIPNMVYVTTFEGQTLTVKNLRVSNDLGAVVFVGSDDYSANKIEVLYSLNLTGSTNAGQTLTGSNVAPHSHGYDSVNPSWIQSAQFLPLLTLPYSGLTVQVYPGVIRTSTGGLKWFAGAIVDLTSYYPASGALWAAIQIEDDGTTTVEVGATAAARADLDETDIPAETTGKRIVAIILDAGFDELFRNNVRNDFLDLRFFALESGGTVYATDVSYTPIDVNDWDYLADPGDVDEALDQLAARTADLEGSGAGGGDNTFTDLYASRPAASQDGNLFFPSDGFSVQRDSGAAWVPWGPLFPLTAPVLTNFAWINQGGATAVETNGGIHVNAPVNAGDSYRILKMAAPTPPYTIEIAFLGSLRNVNYHAMGLVWRQSSDGKIVSCTYDGATTGYTYNSAKWTNATTYSAAYISNYSHSSIFSNVKFLRIRDDNTNRYFDVSIDGQNWVNVHSVGRTDFLTADEVGISLNVNNASFEAAMTLLSWKAS